MVSFPWDHPWAKGVFLNRQEGALLCYGARNRYWQVAFLPKKEFVCSIKWANMIL